MLPAKRVSVGELWRSLTSDHKTTAGPGGDRSGLNAMNGMSNVVNGNARSGDGSMRGYGSAKRARSQGRKGAKEGMWWSK